LRMSKHFTRTRTPEAVSGGRTDRAPGAR
jgi:hypothetical protein